MKIDFEGRVWDFDADLITLKQGVAIHMAYGMTVGDFVDGLKVGKGDGANVRLPDPRSMHVLYWLMLQQDGQVKALADANANLVDLMGAYLDGLKAEVEAQVAAAQPEPEPDVVPTSPPPGDRPWSGHGYQTATTQPSGGNPYPPQHDRTGYSPSPSPGYGAST